MYDIESLVNDGFNRSLAKAFFSRYCNEMNSDCYETSYRDWAHDAGFLVEDACAYGLSVQNINSYISSYDYCRSFPFNGWSRIWIDDKLTLKLCLGDRLSHFMPEYYYYSTPNGLRSLCDNPLKGRQGPDGLLDLLREKGELACKPNNGSLSAGFMKLEHVGGIYYMNGKESSTEEVVAFALSNPNLLFTEYLHPCEEWEKVHDLVPTLRLIVVNTEGNNPRIVCGYIRFGTSGCGSANYTSDDDSFNYFVNVDVDSGFYLDGRKVFHNRVEKSPRHPDSGILVEGKVPSWEKVVSMVEDTARRLFNVEYMGYDITISEGDEPKIMEINSHPQIKIPQMYGSLLKKKWVRDYFNLKLN